MKKLLLILICLFVSFEVKSKEEVLSCILTKRKILTDTEIKTKKFEELLSKQYTDVYEDLTLYFDKKNKWLLDRTKENFLDRENEDDFEIIFRETDVQYTFILNYKKDIYENSVYLSRYSGLVEYSFQDGLMKRVFQGKCEKVKKKLF